MDDVEWRLLSELAQTNPAAFVSKRRAMIEAAIVAAPLPQQGPLRLLQDRVDQLWMTTLDPERVFAEITAMISDRMDMLASAVEALREATVTTEKASRTS